MLNYALPSQRVARSMPTLIEEVDVDIFRAELSRVLPAVTFISVGKSNIPPSGFLFAGFVLSKLQFNLKPSLKSLGKSYLRSLFSLLKLRKKTHFIDALYVSNSGSNNFFHWFLDVLQKIECLQQLNKNTSLDRYPIIIPYRLNSSYVQLTLKAFNIKFYNQNKDELITVENLIFLPDAAPTGNYRKELVLLLQKRLRKLWISKNPTTTDVKRIYITRKNAKIRRIVNENDIYPLLEQNGFHIIDFDLLGFERQVELAIDCEILISLHGAGLTHMLWMRNAGKVLEIRARGDAINNCYFSLASDLDHAYHYCFADKICPQQSTQVSDFVIDPDQFKSKLHQLCA